MGPLLPVAAGIVQAAGQVLLAQRKPSSHLGDSWEFPGGKIEPWESPASCLRREFREELGVDVEVLEPFTFTYFEYATQRVLLLFYFCRIVAGTPSPADCQAVAWFPLEALRSLPMPAADRPIVEALLERTAAPRPSTPQG